jgi:hypothetical protein
MHANQALCMECADLDHLAYLESGDAAMTRRATKHSSLWAVVVRFSRSRGRYERQGVLVQPEALEKAGEECLADADLRAAREARDAERREVEDVELAARMAEKIRALYPGCPPEEARGRRAYRRAGQRTRGPFRRRPRARRRCSGAGGGRICAASSHALRRAADERHRPRGRAQRDPGRDGQGAGPLAYSVRSGAIMPKRQPIVVSGKVMPKEELAKMLGISPSHAIA